MPAVKSIDIELPGGGFAAVVGPSGSGKSSLLAMIGGLSRPTAGAVRVEDTDIWSLPDEQLAQFRNRRIGFVFQFPSLLPTLRVIDNVALPAMLGMVRDLAVLPKGIALARSARDVATARAYPAEISAGEQRRAAIARALINDPALLLADEPTSDLDALTESEIMDQFLRVTRIAA